MYLAELFESELSDYLERHVAQHLHTRIKMWLEENSSKLRRVDQGDFEGCFYLEVRRLDPEYKDLWVLFVPKDMRLSGHSVNGGLIQKEGLTVVIINCMKALDDLSNIELRFGTKERSFVHEFMHYLLHKRQHKETKSSVEKLNAHGEGAYYNDAQETNAFYQEAVWWMERFMNTLAAKAPKELQAFSDKSTPELISYMKKVAFDTDFIKHADVKTMRALDKRLYRFIERTLRPRMKKGAETAPSSSSLADAA